MGVQPMHQRLERPPNIRHSTTRQLMAPLERYGVEPEDPLTPGDLAGPPLPRGAVGMNALAIPA